jgi:hypothetical protein
MVQEMECDVLCWRADTCRFKTEGIGLNSPTLGEDVTGDGKSMC